MTKAQSIGNNTTQEALGRKSPTVPASVRHAPMPDVQTRTIQNDMSLGQPTHNSSRRRQKRIVEKELDSDLAADMGDVVDVSPVRGNKRPVRLSPALGPLREIWLT